MGISVDRSVDAVYCAASTFVFPTSLLIVTIVKWPPLVERKPFFNASFSAVFLPFQSNDCDANSNRVHVTPYISHRRSLQFFLESDDDGRPFVFYFEWMCSWVNRLELREGNFNLLAR